MAGDGVKGLGQEGGTCLTSVDSELGRRSVEMMLNGNKRI